MIIIIKYKLLTFYFRAPKMKKKSQMPLENYVLLQLRVLQMNQKPFNINMLQRVLRSSCKCSRIKDKVIFFNLKGSKNTGLRIEVQNDNYFVITDNLQKFEFHLFADTTKELLNKILYHNLLKP